jgi:hypothetical protein
VVISPVSTSMVKLALEENVPDVIPVIVGVGLGQD